MVDYSAHEHGLSPGSNLDSLTGAPATTTLKPIGTLLIKILGLLVTTYPESLILIQLKPFEFRASSTTGLASKGFELSRCRIVSKSVS